jgi:hypothetical protein
MNPRCIYGAVSTILLFYHSYSHATHLDPILLSCYVSFLSGGAEIWKGRRLQLMGCTPDVLLVLSICGSRKIGVRSEVTWSENQSLSQRYGCRRSEDTGSEVRDVGELEKTLDKRRLRVRSLH